MFSFLVDFVKKFLRFAPCEVLVIFIREFLDETVTDALNVFACIGGLAHIDFHEHPASGVAIVLLNLKVAVIL